MPVPQSIATFLLLTVLPACLIPATTHARDTSPEYAGIASLRASGQRPFGGPVTREEAAAAAAAAANDNLRKALVRTIVTRPEVRFAKTPGASSAPQPDLAALADAVTPSRVVQVHYFADPPTAEVTVSPAPGTPDADLSGAIRDGLIQSGRLDLYRRAMLREQKLLAEFDALATADDQRADAPETTKRRTRLHALANGLEAVTLYRKTLSRLDGIWQEPQAVLTAMHQALTLDNNNPDLHAALGEAYLQLGRSHEAMEAQSHALRLDPDFARAYHSRGVAYLALRLPALATADFTEAIRLSPHTPVYHRDRGMAWLVQKETTPMCHDFYSACALGDCEKYRWAVDQGTCSPSP